MNDDKFVLPAEWERDCAVLLSWPHEDTDWAYMLEPVTHCYIEIARAVSRRAKLIIVSPDASAVAHALKGFVPSQSYSVIEMPTNDTWARDFGPIVTCGKGGGCLVNDFKFNGWGLKFAADRDNLITRNLVASGVFRNDAGYANRLGFVLEGGSIDVSEDGTLITTAECLLSPNRNGDLTKAEIDSRLREYLGCGNVLWLEHGFLAGDDTDSHVDTLARFLPGGIIAYSSCDRPDDLHYGELLAMEEELRGFVDAHGHPYRLVPLPIPDAIHDADGLRLPATYANFLIVNGAVFVPVYGDSKYDALAVKRLGEALPDYEVVTLPCRPLVEQHGSLHCATMQIPMEIMR